MATIKPGIGQLLADVQVTAVAAGATIQTISTTTNTVGSSVTQMTANSVNSTQPTPRTVWDGLYLVIFPGVLAAGQSEPDLWMYVQVDNVSFQDNFYIDMSISGNMFPRRDNTVGRDSLILGNSMLKIASTTGKFPDKNTPLAFTGWKITKDISFFFFSQGGFASTVFAQPPTVQLYGDVYDIDSLSTVQRMLGQWNGSINLQSARRSIKGLAPYTNFHTIPGVLNLDTFATLPGGAKQGSVRVFRYFKTSQPLVATTGQAVYPLTTINQVGGKVGNVGTHSDLGYDFTANRSAIKITEFGRIPGSGAGYTGLTFGGSDQYPYETAFGLVCTPANPRIPYGQVQPIRPESNLYYRLSRWGDWSPGEVGPEIIAAETGSFFISAQNGTTIAAAPTTGSTVTFDRTTVGGAIVIA